MFGPTVLSALAVEPHRRVAAVITGVLERAGFVHAVNVPDCGTAAARVADRVFDVVLIDVSARHRDEAGFSQLCRALAASGTPVALMAPTGERSVLEIARTECGGFVLLKPFTPEQIRLKLAERGVRLPGKPVQTVARRVVERPDPDEPAPAQNRSTVML